MTFKEVNPWILAVMIIFTWALVIFFALAHAPNSPIKFTETKDPAVAREFVRDCGAKGKNAYIITENDTYILHCRD